MAQNTKQYSRKQERLVAKELEGCVVSLSGAGPANPGDVRTYEWLVECKTHTTPDHPITFNLDVWKKLQNEAMGVQKKPVLIVDDGSQTISKTWCLCKAANLNLAGSISTDLPVTIRKNISCKHDKLSTALKAVIKGKIHTDSFYGMSPVLYEVNWGDDVVVVLPLTTFKELIEK